MKILAIIGACVFVYVTGFQDGLRLGETCANYGYTPSDDVIDYSSYVDEQQVD